MLNNFFKRYRLLIETALMVIAVIGLKLLIEFFSLAFIEMTALFTSVIAGGIFILSIILSGTLADYKESEKLPAEIANSVENIYQEGWYVQQTKKGFNLDRLRQNLDGILKSFKKDLATKNSREALIFIENLSDSFLEMEKLEVPPNFIVRLKQEQSIIRKNFLRVYHIQRTNFLPSAQILTQSIVFLILLLLIFTKIEPVLNGIIMVAFVSYLFIYLLRLLRIIDTPFRVDEHTMDDVSLFLLRETRERIKLLKTKE